MKSPLSPVAFEAAIRDVGRERYHDKHPFHKLLHGGHLDKRQVQAWALNRYCYQAAVPRKDAALISRAHDRGLRREWIQRLLDHDGIGGEEGGIERWLRLTDGLGLDRDYVTSMQGALPATRFAVEAYVRFVREQSLTAAVASSLTELFAPALHEERIAGMLAHYDFIDEGVLAYFHRRLSQANRDAEFALDYVKREATTADMQIACIEAVQFKCDVLWAQLDALHHAYVVPNLPPPGAFQGPPMDNPVYRQRVAMNAASQPALRQHIKLRRDPVRNRWVLLGPERILTPNEPACDVLRLCDGKRSVAEIAAILAESYDASPVTVETDILRLLEELVDKGVVQG